MGVGVGGEGNGGNEIAECAPFEVRVYVSEMSHVSATRGSKPHSTDLMHDKIHEYAEGVLTTSHSDMKVEQKQHSR